LSTGLLSSEDPVDVWATPPVAQNKEEIAKIAVRTGFKIVFILQHSRRKPNRQDKPRRLPSADIGAFSSFATRNA
jgi:hypothetical protein